jgi:hypothetical protein
MTDAIPEEVRPLLSGNPETFVAERDRLVRELRREGRQDDAARVSQIRKPAAVVLAVNRAARDRPQALRDAIAAADRLRTTQLEGDPESYADASDDLARALELLEQVALAQLSRNKNATEATRRRVRQLLRTAVVDRGAREALARGMLVAEPEASGFAAFEGVKVPRRKRSPDDSRADKHHERREKLEKELAEAETALRTAEEAATKAERERERRSKQVAALREKLERLRDESV